jgi:uncharacterized repeat protein (TIGR03803 family)
MPNPASSLNHYFQRLNLHTSSLSLILFSFAIATASAQTFTRLANFDGANGSTPRGTLTQGLDGNLYGAAVDGGSTGICQGASGCGAIFQATTSGSLTAFHIFATTDGSHPLAAPVQGVDGNFYGTTEDGGLHLRGTVFQLAPSGTLDTLYNFQFTAGQHPVGGLVLATNGNFYGTTTVGGQHGEGTVFRINSGATFKALYSFCALSGCPDGQEPQDGLVQAGDGNFYGVTPVGGTNKFGTIFKITPAGVFTTLHTFCAQTNCTDGATPNVTLVEGKDGNLYGTTEQGGSHFSGTVFRITRAGVYSILHNFCSQPACADGANPLAGLVFATDGTFYGTTSASGSHSRGTIFTVNAQKQFLVVYSFQATDGQFPNQLMEHTNGNFYGTMQVGGTSGVGTFFSLAYHQAPFVKSLEMAGTVGSTVHVYGQGLTGTADVQFNGKSAASFTVVSDTEVTAVVPSGATSGAIQVLVTPNTTYSTNTNFKVLP